MIKRISLLLILCIVFSITGCNSTADKSQGKVSTTNSPKPITQNDKDDYKKFTENAKKFISSYKPNKYTCLTPKDTLNNIQYIIFPEDLKLEKRSNDGVDGDPATPSKFDFYYLKEDKSILIKVRLIYAKTNQVGIISSSIISPDDNDSIDPQFKEIDRPYIVNELIGTREHFLMSIESVLLESDGKESKSKKITKLIQESTEFYRQVENFIDCTKP